MITTISLDTICHHIKLQNFFFWWELLIFTVLATFQYAVQSYWLYSPWYTSFWFIYSITWSLNPLTTLIQFCPSTSPPLLWQPSICSLNLWVYFVLFYLFILIWFLDSTNKWYHVVFVFFFAWYSQGLFMSSKWQDFKIKPQ